MRIEADGLVQEVVEHATAAGAAQIAVLNSHANPASGTEPRGVGRADKRTVPAPAGPVFRGRGYVPAELTVQVDRELSVSSSASEGRAVGIEFPAAPEAKHPQIVAPAPAGGEPRVRRSAWSWR